MRSGNTTMKNLRCRLVPLASVVMYIVIHVLGPALHCHQLPGQKISQSVPDRVVVSSSLTDCDDEDHCPLCSVLRSAQVAPVISHIEGHQAVLAELVQAAALMPNPIEVATHPRAPPAV
jgi:hypothetical protein